MSSFPCRGNPINGRKTYHHTGGVSILTTTRKNLSSRIKLFSYRQKRVTKGFWLHFSQTKMIYSLVVVPKENLDFHFYDGILSTRRKFQISQSLELPFVLWKTLTSVSARWVSVEYNFNDVTLLFKIIVIKNKTKNLLNFTPRYYKKTKAILYTIVWRILESLFWSNSKCKTKWINCCGNWQHSSDKIG